jgi:hypothetical protein
MIISRQSPAHSRSPVITREGWEPSDGIEFLRGGSLQKGVKAKVGHGPGEAFLHRRQKSHVPRGTGERIRLQKVQQAASFLRPRGHQAERLFRIGTLRFLQKRRKAIEAGQKVADGFPETLLAV